MRTVKPAANMIFGTVEKSGPQSQSGLYVPESAKQKIAISKILAVGSNVTEYKAGQSVLYKEYTQHDIKVDGEDFVLIEIDDVLGQIVEVKEADAK